MCEVSLGQCGPRVPLLKSLFNVYKLWDEPSVRRGDRQAELQSIWQEIGEDKNEKQEEIRQMIAFAVDKIYDKALEECVRRKSALEETVVKSENRLKELMGAGALQVIAAKELPLQTRLSVNMARLHDLDSARVGGYGWVGGLVVLVELRHRVVALREMLKLPPCANSADLDEILANTTEALHDLYPGKVSLPSFSACKGDQKLIFQRLQRFYSTLCAMESVWVEIFAQKDEGRTYGYLDSGETATHNQELEETRDTRKRNWDFLRSGRETLPSTVPISPFGCAIKRSSSKGGSKSKSSRHIKQCSEEASTLEQLSHKILRKLEDLNKQVKCVALISDAVHSPCSPCSQSSDLGFSPSSGTIASVHKVKNSYTPYQSASVSPSSDEIKDSSTPTSVLPETKNDTSSPDYYVNIGATPLIWSTADLALDKALQSSALPPEHQSVFPFEQSKDDLPPEGQPLPDLSVNSAMVANNIKPVNLFGVQSENAVSRIESSSNRGATTQSRRPLVSITKSQLNLDHSVPKKQGALAAPPPPPPPPPPGGAMKPAKSTKLKRSATMGKIYINMKRKVEGAAFVQPGMGEALLPRRSLVGGGTREGMAEALAEITKKSAYFRKIEDDVQQHASSILKVKIALESFETNNMEELLKFQQNLEAHLENLTDESQVLARFEGFPSKKLETIRSAASLYSRLHSSLQHINNWRVEPPLFEQLDKVTCCFDKIKVEIEGIERAKDDDTKRFANQKIHFSFEIITHIKEAVVDLSSRCLSLALEDSKRAKASSRIEDGYISSRDMKKLRTGFQMLWKAFQLAYRIYNFAGGQDDEAEELTSELAREMETYPSHFWIGLVT